MREDELRDFDLNLLVPLQALLAECHITRASRRVGMSQPAMSRALARLRELFGDPLLVSTATGLRPTNRALEIQGRLRNILDQLSGLVARPDFDPAKARGEVRLAVPDVIAYQLVPKVLNTMRTRAPHLVLRIVQWQADFREQLESGEVDLSIGQPTGAEPGIYQHVLTTVDWVSVVRKDHPCLSKVWTRELFAELPHLLVSITGRGGGQVDEALSAYGLSRRIAATVPYGLLSPLIVAESDLVLTTSRWVALKFSQQVPLVVRRPPIDLKPLAIPMVWHERTHEEQRARWVRGALIEAAKTIEPQLLRNPEVPELIGPESTQAGPL